MAEAPETGGEPRSTSLAHKLWKAHFDAPKPKPADKEFQEADAFLRQAAKALKKRKVVVDAVGGHGMLGMMAAAVIRCEEVYILDLKLPASHHTMAGAFAPFIGHARVAHELGDVGATLPALLRRLLDRGDLAPADIIVVGVHACGFLSDVILDACVDAGVDFAVCPCCHKDEHRDQITVAAKSLGIPMGAALDLVRFGRLQQRGYSVSWRTLPASITPENRVLVGTPETATSVRQRADARAAASKRMLAAYKRNAVAPGTKPRTRDAADGTPPPKKQRQSSSSHPVVVGAPQSDP